MNNKIGTRLLLLLLLLFVSLQRAFFYYYYYFFFMNEFESGFLIIFLYFIFYQYCKPIIDTLQNT